MINICGEISDNNDGVSSFPDWTRDFDLDLRPKKQDTERQYPWSRFQLPSVKYAVDYKCMIGG